MKLHIECLQEKLDQIQKEGEALKGAEETKKKEHKKEIDGLKKIIQSLEVDLNSKVEKLKANEAIRETMQKEIKLERVRQDQRVRSIQ